MKLVADESVDRPILDLLRRDGFEILAIADVARGSSDDEVLARAVSEQSLLLTADKDFGDLVFRQQKASPGVVLLRLAGVPQDLRSHLVHAAFRDHAEQFLDNFTVIDSTSLRVRKTFRTTDSEG